MKKNDKDKLVKRIVKTSKILLRDKAINSVAKWLKIDFKSYKQIVEFSKILNDFRAFFSTKISLEKIFFNNAYKVLRTK